MVTPRQVLLFVPNLIGYARVVLLLAALAVSLSDPVLFLVFYAGSFLLDAADGYAARLLGQSSRFGAVLDMVTDRVATNALVLLLSHLFPRALLWFQLLSLLDLSSHWLRMYSTLLGGVASHKDATPEHDGYLISLYYNVRVVLGGVCLFNEFFYIGLYAVHFFPAHYHLLKWVIYVTAPVFVFKQYLNILQLINSCRTIAHLDASERNKKH